MHVHHHTLLQSRGGTARVAHSLLAYLAEQRITVSHSYEVQDRDIPGLRLSPKQVASVVATNEHPPFIHHLHASLNWPDCLSAFSESDLAPIITLHDCKLFTGGCAFPINCEKWRTGCSPPCPQKIQRTAMYWKNVHTLVNKMELHFVTPSTWLARMLRMLHPHAIIRVIPNGIDEIRPITTSKREAKKKLGIHPGSRVILFLAHGGKKAYYKGGHLWMDIWKRIKSKEPRAVSLAIGGEITKRYDDFLEFPYLDQSTMAQFWDAADIFLYPSLADNHPLVILEAMSRGIPCITFAVGGIPEQIIHEKTGMLALPNDVNKLVFFALQVLQDPMLSKSIKKASLEHFNRKFNLERMGKSYHDVYVSLLNN